MSALGRLVVSLVAETSKFEGDVGKAALFFNRSMKSLERSAIVAASAIGAKVGATASAMGLLVRNAVNTADQIGKMSQRVGVSTEFLSQLAVQAKLSGTSIDAVATSLTRLAVNASDTAKGTGEAREAFKALGISVVDASGKVKGQQALFEETIGVLARYRDSTNKTAIEQKLLGRSGTELADLVNNYEITKNAAREYGLVVSKDVAVASAKFNDTLTETSFVFKGMAMEALPTLLPRMQRLADAIKDTAKNNKDLLNFGEQTAVMFDALVIAAVHAVTAFRLVGNTIAGVAAAISTFFEGINIQKFVSSPMGALIEMGRVAISGNAERALGVLSDMKDNLFKAVEEQENFLKKLKRDLNTRIDAAKAGPTKDAPPIQKMADADALEKRFRDTLKRLEKELFQINNKGILAEIQFEISDKGSLRGLVKDKQDELLARAKDLQLLKDEVWVRKAVADSFEEINAQRKLLNESTTEAFETNRKNIEQQQFEIGLIGKKAEEVEKLVAVERLRLDFEQQMASLAKSMAEDESGHGFMRRRAEAEAELIENQKKAIEMIDKRRIAERHWTTGAKAALDEYLDAASNVAQQVKNLYVDAFKRMEDALVQFVKTGKLNFRDLANSIIEDLIRIQIKTQVMPGISALMERGLGAIIGAVLPSGAPSAAVGPSGSFGDLHMAEGGPVTAGRPYIVGERGPELFMPNVSGSIIPNGGMGGVSVVQYNSFGAGVSRSELAPMLEANRRVTEASIQNSLLRGGTFASAAGKV